VDVTNAGLAASVNRRSSRRRTVAVAVVAGVAIPSLLGGAALLRSAAGTADRDAEQEGARVAEVDVLALRVDLRRTHLDELNQVMLDAFGRGSADAVAAARAQRNESRRDALELLDQLAAAPGPTSFEAVALRQYLVGDGIADGDGNVDPSLLFDTSYHVSREDRPADELLDPVVIGLYELTRADSPASLILNDALDATYVTELPEVADWLAGYVDRADPYIFENGGYLGSDPERPFVDGWVTPYTELADPAVGTIEQIVAKTPLWSYDQWIISFQTGDPGEPPLALDELAELAEVTDAQTRAVVDERLADVRASAASARDDALDRATWLRGASTALIVLAVVIVLSGIAVIVQRTLRGRRAVLLDPLTGAGNRRLLTQESGARLADRQFVSHVVAAVDLDRFKMVNDGWGHAVGDEVLIEVARRLQTLVNTFESESHQRTVGSVVRMGGDEFVVTLHSEGPIDVSLVHSRLTSIRSFTMAVAPSADSPKTDLLTLSFSVGVVEARTGDQLDDLLRAADLAAYAHKSAKAAESHERRRQVSADDR
jgi:diguanylate cyclase (GGDEF)-like protein